jgi:hypothetical protein
LWPFACSNWQLALKLRVLPGCGPWASAEPANVASNINCIDASSLAAHDVRRQIACARESGGCMVGLPGTPMQSAALSAVHCQGFVKPLNCIVALGESLPSVFWLDLR